MFSSIRLNRSLNQSARMCGLGNSSVAPRERAGVPTTTDPASFVPGFILGKTSLPQR